MSKKHKHNRNFNQQKPNTPENNAPEGEEMDELAESLGGEVTEAPEEPETVDEATAQEQPQTKEQAPVEQETKPVDPPPPPPENTPVGSGTVTPEPKVVAVDLEKKDTTMAPVIKFGRPKVVAKPSELAIKRGGQFIKELTEDPRMHTAAGRQMIQMLNEYEDLLSKSGSGEQSVSTKCTRKLYDIMVACCPIQGSHASNYTGELIKLVFNRMAKGYGTKYSESTLLRLDYTLPSPTESMKFDSFYTALLQLVEAAKTGERIRYNSNALAKVLKSPSAATAITSIRRRLEQR